MERPTPVPILYVVAFCSCWITTDLRLQSWFYLPANQVVATAGWQALNQDNGMSIQVPC
jgi:hypothetical protein